MLEGTRMRTYDYALLHEKDEETQHCRHEEFKGPPSALEWIFGSVGKSKAVPKKIEDEK